jgi:Na+/proline symporter
MDPILSPVQGLILLFVYAALMIGLSFRLRQRFNKDKSMFLLAGRKLPVWEGAFSIAATWIWAPALFLAAQKAYTQGVAGVFWFTVPNIACLIIFGYFAARLRRKLPDGFTLSGYILDRYSPRVHNLYLIQLVGLAVCSFAVQLLAGGKVLAALTGLPFSAVTIILTLIALSYSLMSGLKASVVTDYLQMVIILIVCAVVVPWAIKAGGGWDMVTRGLGGISGEFGSVLNKDVFLTFGIAVTVGLLAGPFGDQSFWQRAFALRDGQVEKSFIRGAVLFALVPLSLCLLGFLAAGMGTQAADPALVNLEVVRQLLPGWVTVVFVFMLLSGLVSTLDSNLCAISSLAGHDIAQRRNKPSDGLLTVAYGRRGMLFLAVGALLVANIPGMAILYLFLFYGTLRASTLLPTVLSILSDNVDEVGVFWGIVIALVVGLPLFAYAKLNGLTTLSIVGSLLTVLSSGLISVLVTAARTKGKSERAA